MSRYWIPVRKNSINIINRSLESNLKGYFYKNTKTTIPNLVNDLHESQPLGYAYETDSHFGMAQKPPILVYTCVRNPTHYWHH